MSASARATVTPPMSHAFRDATAPVPGLVASASCSGLALVGLGPSSEKSVSTSGAAFPRRQTRSAVTRISSSTPAVAKMRDDRLDWLRAEREGGDRALDQEE